MYCAGDGRGRGLREEKNCSQDPCVVHVQKRTQEECGGTTVLLLCFHSAGMEVGGAMSSRWNLELNLIGAILAQWSPTFLAPGTGFMEDLVYYRQGCVWGGWFWDDSSIFHLLCTYIILLLLHHLHLRSSGVRSRRLGTPVLAHLVSGPKQDSLSKNRRWELGPALTNTAACLGLTHPGTVCRLFWPAVCQLLRSVCYKLTD